MRLVRWIGLVLWAGSWVLMVFEVFRWHHLTPTLRFNPGPPGPYGPGRLGLPAQAARACAFVAPVVVLLTFVRPGVSGSGRGRAAARPRSVPRRARRSR
jgi:hypothetical protein